jgi:hypothetical protein
MKRLLLAALFVLPFAACGGGGGSSSDVTPNTNAAGTAAMAAAFTKELTTIKQCLQDEVDGKGDCQTSFFSDPVTLMCSDVHLGRASQFAGADYTKFDPTCTAWASVLSVSTAEKVTKIDQMLTDLQAVK